MWIFSFLFYYLNLPKRTSVVQEINMLCDIIIQIWLKSNHWIRSQRSLQSKMYWSDFNHTDYSRLKKVTNCKAVFAVSNFFSHKIDKNMCKMKHLFVYCWAFKLFWCVKLLIFRSKCVNVSYNYHVYIIIKS